MSCMLPSKLQTKWQLLDTLEASNNVTECPSINVAPYYIKAHALQGYTLQGDCHMLKYIREQQTYHMHVQLRPCS